MSPRSLHVLEFSLGLIALLIFFNSPVVYISDSKYSMLTSESLLRNGTPDLSGYKIPRYEADLPFNTIEGRHAYQLQRINGRLLYGFPHGSCFLSIPFVAMFDALGVSTATGDGEFNLAGEIVLQKTLAAALMAVFVVLSFRTALLFLDWKWSLLVAIATGFGTQVWSVASRGVWSHTWEITLGMAAVYLLVRGVIRGVSIRPVLLATLLAWMYFTRPTAAVIALMVALYVLIYRREQFLWLAGTGIVWMAIFTWYTYHFFGSPFPLYYGAQGWTPAELPVAMYGNLFGPARGLFVYCPVVAFVFYWVVLNSRAIPYRALAALSLTVIAGLIFVSSANKIWWGGACFGPRYLTDALPWLVLLATLGIAAIPPEQRTLRNPSIALACVALMLSIAINGEGAWSEKAQEWNYQGPFPGLMLDWSRPQFLAPWMPVGARLKKLR